MQDVNNASRLASGSGPEPPHEPLKKLLDALETADSASDLAEQLFTIPRETSNGFTTIGRGSKLQLRVAHTSGSAVQYHHASFVGDNKDHNMVEFLKGCSLLARPREDVKKNRVTPASVVKSATSDWNNLAETLGGKYKVLHIKCLKGSRDLKPWNFEVDFVKDQVKALAIGATIRFLQNMRFEKSDTKNGFTNRYKDLIPAEYMRTAPQGIWQGNHIIFDSLIEWLRRSDDGVWINEVGRQDNMVYYTAGLEEHLDSLRTFLL